MTEGEARTVTGLANTLKAVAHDYLQSFEPTADVDVASIRLELNGPRFSLVFAQTGPNGPSVTLQMNEIESTVKLTDYSKVIEERQKQAEREQKRGMFGRGDS